MGKNCFMDIRRPCVTDCTAFDITAGTCTFIAMAASVARASMEAERRLQDGRILVTYQESAPSEPFGGYMGGHNHG
jgi:hypothetical protein